MVSGGMVDFVCMHSDNLWQVSDIFLCMTRSSHSICSLRSLSRLAFMTLLERPFSAFVYILQFLLSYVQIAFTYHYTLAVTCKTTV